MLREWGLGTLYLSQTVAFAPILQRDQNNVGRAEFRGISAGDGGATDADLFRHLWFLCFPQIHLQPVC